MHGLFIPVYGLIRKSKSHSFQEELIDAMAVFDKAGSGYLDRDILEDLIRNQGEGLNDREIREFLKSIEYNDDGKISYDDFLRIVYNEREHNQ